MCIRDRPLAGPLQLPPQHYLIDPYLLGVWLGDGDSNGGYIYSGSTDIQAFAHLGKPGLLREASGRNKQDFYRISVPDLRVRLRVLGLLHNKHIPEAYLLGSVSQRMSLLQGLMDTDGHCDLGGHCVFTSKRGPLANQVAQLVSSLSMKAHQRETYSVVDGEKFGPYYEVRFTPPERDTKIFRLLRKQARVKGAQNARTRYRYIVSVEPEGERAVNCIQVEKHLYTVGDRFLVTHNSLTTDVFWPSWEWGPKNQPGLRYVSASYSEALTIRDNRRCRNLIRSEWYQRRWGKRFQLVGDQNAKVRYDNDHYGFKIATSVGGLGTGERGDRFIIDDPHNVVEGESDLKRRAVLLWFDESVTTRVNDPETSAIVVIMQRVHDKDVSGDIISRDLGYTHLKLPMEFEPEERCRTYFFRDPRKEEGELLWPARMPAEVVERDKKTMGTYAVAAQFQQRPTPRGGGMFKRDWFEVVEAVPATGTVVRGWDLAASETLTAAFTSGVKMRRTPEGIFYIEDVVRFRGSPGKVDQTLKNTTSQDGYMVRVDLPQDPGQAGKSQVKYFTRLLAGYNVRCSTAVSYTHLTLPTKRIV